MATVSKQAVVYLGRSWIIRFPLRNTITLHPFSAVYSHHALLHSFLPPGRGQRALYPLMEPIMMPLTKYFCRKGYTHMIGAIVIMMAAYFSSVV